MWQSTLDNETLYKIYGMTIVNFCQRPYIRLLVNKCNIPIIRFLTTNNKLPVNVERYEGIERQDRICTNCDLNIVGDEFPYLFVCPFFNEKRNELIPKNYIEEPNVIKFEKLIYTKDKHILLKLKHFICIINR